MIDHATLVELVVLSLAAFRLTRLLGWDELTVPLRAWATRIPDREYNSAAQFIENLKASGVDPWGDESEHRAGLLKLGITRRRYYVAKLVRCAWCAGFWISTATWVAWSVEPRVTLWLAVPLALSALVGLVAKRLDP